ncbi:hypothetical protein Vadar_022696 [Vaccinium darrowii]|nr:hypothetical protein Vadar_022696 [Vaccinium darrowii]
MEPVWLEAPFQCSQVQRKVRRDRSVDEVKSSTETLAMIGRGRGFYKCATTRFGSPALASSPASFMHFPAKTANFPSRIRLNFSNSSANELVSAEMADTSDGRVPMSDPLLPPLFWLDLQTANDQQRARKLKTRKRKSCSSFDKNGGLIEADLNWAL